MHKQPVLQDCAAPLAWDQLSDLAKTSITSGLPAESLVSMAYLLLDAAAEMRRAGLGGRMARA